MRQLSFCRQRDKYLSESVAEWMNLCRRYAEGRAKPQAPAADPD